MLIPKEANLIFRYLMYTSRRLIHSLVITTAVVQISGRVHIPVVSAGHLPITTCPVWKQPFSKMEHSTIIAILIPAGVWK